MEKIALVSSTEGTIKIKIRCLNFSKEKRRFVEERAIARDLFMPQMGWGGLEFFLIHSMIKIRYNDV